MSVGDLKASAKANQMSLIPVRVPLIDLGRHLEAEPDACLEADPVNDLLTNWIQRKYGQDSIPYKLASDARQVGLRNANRRGSVSSGDSSMQSTIFANSSADAATAKDSLSGLFLLFDA